MKDNSTKQKSTAAIDLTKPFAWRAPEGIKVDRGPVWYVMFAIVFIVLIVLAIWVFNSWSFAILLPLMAISVILLTSSDPREINFAISPKGVYVSDKLYDFSEFRGFGIIEDDRQHSILLLPVKRFSPGLTIYFSEKDGEKIVDMLGARLPMQEIKPDIIDKFIRLIKL